MRNNNTNTIVNNLPKQRIWELDFIRGFCVLLMIFDHTMYDIADIFGSSWYDFFKTDFTYNLWRAASTYYYTYNVRQFVEPLVVFIFCFICGISCSFSKSNLKRGVQIAICSILITIVTTLIESPITFGIFQMFTVAILFWCVIDFVCRHNKIKTAFACGIIGIAIITINYVFMQIYSEDINAFAIDNKFYYLGKFMVVDSRELWLTTNDYQPIFPLVGYMLLGASLGPILYRNKKSLLPHLGKYDWYTPINFWGKTAMWVYILHQVVIGAILGVISFVLTGDWVII